MDEALRKKYIPMTETTYYTLLAVTIPRHGYAIMQYVSGLTKGRIVLGTGTLYTMVGRLAADGVIVTVPGNEKKAYQITDTGRELLLLETKRLGRQLADGTGVLGLAGTENAAGAAGAADMAGMAGAADTSGPADRAAPASGDADRAEGADFQNGGGVSTGHGVPVHCEPWAMGGRTDDRRGEDFRNGPWK